MVQEITPRGSIAGRLGKSLGEGLANTVPKELERYRLAKGLEQVKKNSANQTPFERYSSLLTLPGLTAQGLQGASDLLRQEAQGNALKDIYKPAEAQPERFPEGKSKDLAPGSKTPSIEQAKPLEQIQEGYISPTEDEIIKDGARRYNDNPKLFPGGPEEAITQARNAAAQNEKINEQYLAQHNKLSAIQKNVVDRLRVHSDNLGVKIPANVYSKIEDEAIQATKPKKQGGQGKTEQQSVKDTGEILDAVSRDYSDLASVGNWGIVANKPSETLRTLKSLQSSFEKRNDTENLADTMTAEHGFSPKFAYAFAEPVSRDKELNSTIRSLKPIKGIETIAETAYPESVEKTLEIAPKLAEQMSKKSSPLAIAYELEKKHYDPQAWLEYLTRNKRKLGLTASQERQLSKPISLLGNFNDYWLQSFSGIEE